MQQPLYFRRKPQETGRTGRACRTGRAIVLSVLWGASLCAVGGCGGGTGRATSPSATQAASRSASLSLALTWPDAPGTAHTAGRAFPVAANSLTVTVTDASGFIDSRTLVRPPSGSANTTVTANFFALSPGQTTIVASAFAAFDGSGPVLSQASTSVSLQSGTQTGTTLDFASPIVSVGLAPNAPSLLLGTSVQLTPIATDDRNQTSTPTGTFLSANPTIATVDATGKVTGAAVGTTQISFTDTVSGKSGTASVTVRGITLVVLSPANSKVVPGASVTLSATGQDANGVVQTNPPGVWSTSDASIATVDASGTVTGLRAGTVIISFRDSVFGITGTTTVSVRGGDAQVIVQ